MSVTTATPTPAFSAATGTEPAAAASSPIGLSPIAASPLESSLGHKPSADRWTFDASVTGCFSDMLRRSIPDLDAMRRITTQVAEHYRRDESWIVDLGASRGDAVFDLVRRYSGRNTFGLVETSEPMLAELRNRFNGYVAAGRVKIYDTDLRRLYPCVEASVTLAVLTLQFTPIEHRWAILRRAYQHTRKGGCVILVEKVIGSSAEMHDLLTTLYHGHKRASGYTHEEIEAKARSLESVLVPVTAEANESMLRRTGFREVECVWRSLSFAAWVAVK